ncbi:hypothetical protein FUAX_27870 [Fulvitalea axinellae]|uniref:DUF4180 domain-containing protein n=1 Tax=Fulvitalea axinellae TaxID=1182444 RepID=A0AAU9CLZ7_9BACT|nr:hypothetical protein FUAX_27870 [Fulvitalea axinellae]
MVKVYESAVLVIEYDKEHSSLTCVWSGFASEKAYKEGIEAQSRLVKELGVVSIMVDARKQGVLPFRYAEFSDKAVDEMIESDLRYIVYVLPENVFSRQAILDYKARNEGERLVFRCFDSYEQAKRWRYQLFSLS